MKKKLFITFIALNLVVFLTCGIVVFAAVPSISSTNPQYDGRFYLQGESYSIDATVYNSPNSVKFYVPQEDIIADVNLSLQSADYYVGTWVPNAEDSEYAKLYYGSYIGWWELEFAAKNGDGLDQEYVEYCVPKNPLSTYEYVDNEFWFSSPSANDFYEYPSDEYNCAAYSVGVYNDWYEPADIVDFMEKDGIWSSRSGSTYTQTLDLEWCRVIYYDGYHWAKVTMWDANGNPLAVRSKWGAHEVIDSDGYDPFENIYGSASLYFE